MPGASLALFADLGACHAQKSSVTICVLPAPFRWRATGTGMSMQTAVQISIHALRVEGDHLPLSFLHTVLYFYPRPPGWRATTVGRIACAFEQFLSTPSGWRATAKTDKVFICFCAKGRRICLFKTREEKICRWRFKKDKFWVLIWCEGSGKSVCASASHCG